MVVDVGFAVTLAPVVADNPVPGAQVYVLPPVAANVVYEPVHIATLDPPPIVGKGLTVTVTAAVFTQPLLPVTVYVVVEVGLAVTFAPVVADKPVPGAHV